MKNLFYRIKLVCPTAKNFTLVCDDAGNETICSWNETFEQPTQDQLNAVSIQADLIARQDAVRAKRSSEYPPIVEQVGSIIKALKYLSDHGVDIGQDGRDVVKLVQDVKNANLIPTV